MFTYIQKRFAVTREGAISIIKACFCSFLQNMALMFPVSLLYFFVVDLLNGEIIQERKYFYIIACILALVFIIITSYFQYNSSFLATYIESGKRRINLAEKLRKIPLAFFGKKDLADLTSTIMNDCATLETVSSHAVPGLVGSVISTSVIAVSIFFFNWKMALACLWVLPASFLIMFFSKTAQEKVAAKTHKSLIACADGIQEYIDAIKDLKACNAEKDYLDSLYRKIDAYEKNSMKGEIVIGIFVVSSALILKLGIATAALVGVILFCNESLQFATFFMYLLLASRLYEPLTVALQRLGILNNSKINSDRMNKILVQKEQTGKTLLENKGCDVEYSNVDFCYENGREVLHNVSFIAKQNEVTALVGPSGCGKSTALRLASRFYDLTGGKITVGGMDIAKIDSESLMKLYSIVFQDVTLFDNTIMENIRIGKKDASDEEVLKAAKLANVDSFVSKLPGGYSTQIGENGCRLSGGERQRISIARAFLKDAPVILLDEATASLDVENETKVQESISRLIENKTVIVIAHKMRTVIDADKIIVLKDGRVFESGKPQDLLSRESYFRHMVEQQKQSF